MTLIGFVDTLTETGISGWAADPADLERQVNVDVLINTVLVATVRGAEYRDDLRKAGFGDGCKAFQFDPAPYLKPGRNEIEVRHSQTCVPLGRGRGRLIGCGSDLAACDLQFAAKGPILAHVHVPKCAGTSFRILLENHLAGANMRLYEEDPDYVYAEDQLRICLLRDPHVQAFSSHNVRRYPAKIAGREILYVTFLRDPLEQFISYITHKKKHYAVIKSKRLIRAVPPDTPRLGLREISRWILTHEHEVPFRRNYTVDFFARHNAVPGQTNLEVAKSVLDQFFFVGITEQMDESVNKLRQRAHATGFDFPPGPISIENSSSDYRRDLEWIHPDDEVGSLLLDSLQDDRRLYEWALARFQSDLNHSRMQP